MYGGLNIFASRPNTHTAVGDGDGDGGLSALNHLTAEMVQSKHASRLAIKLRLGQRLGDTDFFFLSP
jgi:hypothetical protein